LKLLVTGAGGLVGSSLVSYCEMLGDEVTPYSRESLDITNRESVFKTFAAEPFEVVINCAAWTDVDGCESDVERAFLVNAEGPENLAKACREIGATFVTISTDYVFDGSKQGFYTQLDEPSPLSIYGKSKLEGEQRTLSAHPSSVVARTGFVFGVGGRNFLSTVVARGQQGERLKAISDAQGTPTHAGDLSARLRELALLRTSGIFHVVNSGTGASYEDFVRFALEIAGLDQRMVEPVSQASLNRPAPRPSNSRLQCLRSASVGLEELPDWQNAVRRFVAEEGGRPSLAGGVAPARS
jgi:dTDP-4-dehydrorhamnose reductase